MSGTRTLVLLVLTVAVAATIYLGLRRIGIETGGPRPDLRFATYAKPDPPLPGPSSAVDLKIDVTNDGSASLDETVEVVAFDADPREGGQPQRVAVGQLDPPLAPKESRTVSLPFVAPDEARDVKLFFAIDPDGAVTEVTRENNVIPTTVRVIPPRPPTPDLVIRKIRFEPAAPRVDQDLLIVAVVANEGDGATSDAVIVDLYVNDRVGPQPRMPGTRRLRAPPLQPDETFEVSSRMRFAGPQLLKVYAQVDTDGEIHEATEGNNVAGPEIVAVGSAQQSGDPDLIVESLELVPPTAVLGETGKLKVQGKADTTSSFSVNLKFGPEGPPPPGFPDLGDEPNLSVDLRFLAAGQSYRLPDIPIPFHSGGAWRIAVEVDPYDEVKEGDGEGNNRKELELRVALPR
jgi:hypothetical protein